MVSSRKLPADPTAPAGWWPVDVLLLAWLVSAGLLVALYWRRLPDLPELAGYHIGGAVLLVGVVRWGNYMPRAARLFRYWYPLPYVAAAYKEMSILIPAVRGADLDAALARLDFQLWGAHPTVWLERIQSPALTESLQIVYSVFVPMVLAVAFLLWRKRRYREFRYYAFLIALGFLASYAGYLIVPARGPRFLLHSLQHTDLRGLWASGWLRHTLDRLESAHYDCFPSGHTEMILLAWWSVRRLSRKLFAFYSVYTLAMVFATVYLRYHYTIDVFAGAVLSMILLMATPALYRGGERLLIGRD